MGELLGEAKAVGAVLTDAQMQVDTVDLVPEVGEDVPQGEAVLAAGDAEDQAILGAEHLKSWMVLSTWRRT